MKLAPARVFLSWLALSLIVIGYTARTVSAQVLYGSIVGTLTDQTSAVVPKATVSVTNTSTGLSRQVTTNEAGYYSIPNLPEGNYDVAVNATGFKAYTQTGVSVRINSVTRTDIVIEIGGVAEQVSVEATSAVLQTATTDVSTNLDTRAMENLPLSGYRNYQSLINLVPGATPAQFQNAVTDTPGRSLTTNVNGQDRGANNTRVDGSADILVTMPHHAVYVPPVESIQEVNISTNNFDAEQGMTGGAAVTVITKSGTNDFRGTAFTMYDSSALRTFTWDENRAGVGREAENYAKHQRRQPRRPDQEEQAVLLRELGRDVRTSGLLEHLLGPDCRLPQRKFQPHAGRAHSERGGQPILVPTTEGGSTVLREGMIFDPFSGNEDGTGRSVFSSGGQVNVIPQARLNGPMLKLLALVPQPNLDGDTDNYFNTATQPLNRNNIDAKVNWNRNERQQIWFKYSAMDALVTGDFGLGDAGGECNVRRRRRQGPHARADRWHRARPTPSRRRS